VAASPLVPEIELTIPAQAEFVGIARLAMLGVASRMPFSFDEVEDLRLAVGEACALSIERLNGRAAGDTLTLSYRIEPAALAVEVRSPLTPSPAEATETGPLADVLIRVLMDEVTTEDQPDAGLRVIRLVKNAPG
jgi:serine/threonine-protein kinase RsbW